MSKTEYNSHLDDLKGSQLHHDLKNRPGEKGDPNHAEPEDTQKLNSDLAREVKKSESDTQIADELANLVKK